MQCPTITFEYIPCRGLTEEEQCVQDGGFWYDNACHDTPQGGGGGQGDDYDDAKCLEDLSRNSFYVAKQIAQTGGAVCRRTVNSWYVPSMQDHNFTARFITPVASPVTITYPTFEYVKGKYTTGTVSCTIPAGSNSCTAYSTLANTMPAPTANQSYTFASPSDDDQYYYTSGSAESTLYGWFTHFQP